jgi:two-component system, NarL family, nitrate/nitrite response regulator NarL
LATQPTSVTLQQKSPPVRSAKISILLADETRMGCQLLKNVLTRSSTRFRVVECATTRAEILQALETREVDVALVSADLADGALVGFHILNELRASFPKTRLILLLKSGSEDLVVDAFRGGAKGVFCKSEPIQSLRKSILAVHKGQVWANSQQLHLILEALVSTSPVRVKGAQGTALLGKREEEVANLVAAGLSNREVADKLGLTEHTVSNYLFRTYEKLGLSSRVELVLYIIKQRQQA